jgi:Na+-driven multidrug efflux pump
LALGWWATPLLSAWLGDGFHPEAALALQLLAPGVVANATAHVPFVVLLGANRPEVPAIFHLIQLPITVAVTWFLVSGWGVPGAALAWTARATLDAVGLWGFMLLGRASRS